MWLLLSCRLTADPPPDLALPPPPEPPRLGDGRLDVGEACDPGIGTLRRCDGGWHVCRFCQVDGTWGLRGAIVPGVANHPPAAQEVERSLGDEPALVHDSRWERDALGRVRVSLGHGPDGHLLRTLHTQWDNQGRVLRRWDDLAATPDAATWTSADHGGQMAGKKGVYYYLVEDLGYAYEDHGLLEVATLPNGRVRRTQRDAQGRSVVERTDHVENGVLVDRIENRTISEGSGLERLERRRNGVNEDADMLRKYDANGRLVEESLVVDGQVRPLHGWSFGPDGRVSRWWQDMALDGRPDSVATFTWDDATRTETKRMDTDGDGRPDVVSRTTFRPDGLPNHKTTGPHDGPPDSEVRWTYDEAAVAAWLVSAPAETPR